MHSHNHATGKLPVSDERYLAVRRVTVVGAAYDLVLGVVKLVGGWMFHSQALVADGVHSLSDLATDVLVVFAAKHASRAADEEHPYGHGRIEALATVLLGALLLLVAAGIAWDAGRRLFHPDELLRPEIWAMWIAAISVLVKEAIYHYTMRVARRLRSSMLKANAWHSRSDAISSIIVMLGVAGTMAGLPYLDAIAAVGVAAMIAHIAWSLSRDSLQELIDKGLAEDRLETIRDIINNVSGVRELHMLRTRQSAGQALVEVHILVSPTVSVSEGHQIGETVRHALLDQVEEVHDVTVHIDPEDDEREPASVDLPLRDDLLLHLRRCWQGAGVSVEDDQITLHYLEGKVHVELVLPMAGVGRDCDAARAMASRLVESVDEVESLGGVQVFFKV